MDQSAHFLTFSTRDLDAVRRFYRDGLGWTPLLDVAGEIVFFQIGHGVVLGFFDAARFADDLGTGEQPVSGVTLAHNVGSPEAVRAAVDRAAAAGATVIKQPQEAGFGGFHAHVADPNGVVWEIAHNPGWSVDPGGTVRLSPVG
jgi:catechol 2,3-dioxygenase-like lactoylglutathione lyase family enzyme